MGVKGLALQRNPSAPVLFSTLVSCQGKLVPSTQPLKLKSKPLHLPGDQSLGINDSILSVIALSGGLDLYI